MKPEADPIAPYEATLSELAAIGMRAARVVVRMMEIEQAAADLVAEGLPRSMLAPASLREATEAGLSLDAIALAMAGAVPRVDRLARALERVSRSVRRSIALIKRMQAGWPRAMADDRPAMVRRQVRRGVAEVIRRVSDDEAAERLFDELRLIMAGPGVEQEMLDRPVQETVRQICRELGLAVGEARVVSAGSPAAAAGAPGIVDTC